MVYVALMANPEYAGEEFTGIFYGGSITFLLNQLFGMAVYAGWTAGTSGVMFGLLRLMGWFRVDEKDEDLGVDKAHHGGPAYVHDDFPTIVNAGDEFASCDEEI